jgi:hypothetical protein
MDNLDNTLLIEVTDSKTIGLIRELEKLNLIKVLEENLPDTKPKLSHKYRGKIPVNVAEQMKTHVQP